MKQNKTTKNPEDKEITIDGWNIILFEKTKNGKAFRNWIHDLQNKIKLKTVRLVENFQMCEDKTFQFWYVNEDS